MPIRPDQRYTPATRGSFSTVVSTLEYVPNGPGSLCQPYAAAGSLRSSRGGLQLFRVAEPGVEDWEREAVITADGENDTPRLAAVVERQRHELAAARAQAAVAAVVAMARGVLMERHQCSAAEAAGQLADMAAAAGLPLAEMAAAVLRQDPPSAPEPPPGRRLEPHDPVAAARSERARDGMELVGALAGQPRCGCLSPTAAWRCSATPASAAPRRAGGGGCRPSSTARSSGWSPRAGPCGCTPAPRPGTRRRASCRGEGTRPARCCRCGTAQASCSAWWRPGGPRRGPASAPICAPGCPPPWRGSRRCSACASRTRP